MRIPIIFITLIAPTVLSFDRPEAAPQMGTVTGWVTVRKDPRQPGGDCSEVYVYLESPDTAATAGKGEIVQRNTMFEPRVQVLPVGSTVSFPNNDPFIHNVFSPDVPFDLQRYGQGQKASWTFKTPYEYNIYCDVHMNMAATVKVVPTKWIAKATAGAYTLDVPAGRYKLHAWRPYSTEVLEWVTVTAGQITTVRGLHLVEKPPPAHRNKLNQDYSNTYPKGGFGSNGIVKQICAHP